MGLLYSCPSAMVNALVTDAHSCVDFKVKCEK